MSAEKITGCSRNACECEGAKMLHDNLLIPVINVWERGSGRDEEEFRISCVDKQP